MRLGFCRLGFVARRIASDGSNCHGLVTSLGWAYIHFGPQIPLLYAVIWRQWTFRRFEFGILGETGCYWPIPPRVAVFQVISGVMLAR